MNMLFSKKSAIILFALFLIISLIANIYSFTNQGKARSEYEKNLNKTYEDLSKSEDEVRKLKEQVSLLESKKTDDKNKNSSEGSTKKNEGNPDRNKQEVLENTAKRFMEFSFNSNPETYAERKKLAKNYMTDHLYETIYSADGVAEAEQKINSSLEKVVVYIKENAEDEAIIYYELNREIITTGYSETIQDYAKLKFSEENNQWKVSDISTIEITGSDSE